MNFFKKMFNAETINGRANVAKATYGTFALLYLIHRARKHMKNNNVNANPTCNCYQESENMKTTSASVPMQNTLSESPETFEDGKNERMVDKNSTKNINDPMDISMQPNEFKGGDFENEPPNDYPGMELENVSQEEKPKKRKSKRTKRKPVYDDK